MSRKEKLIVKLKNASSDTTWTLADVVALLSHFGFTKVVGKGSHQVFVSPDFDSPVVLAPHGNPIKSGYIRSIRNLLQP